MNTVWQSFLEQQGAKVDEFGIPRFASASDEHTAAANGTVLIDLSTHVLIRASGSDLSKFLQGQFSNDIHLVDSAHSQLTSYSNPKGRMLATLRVLPSGGNLLLQVPASLRDSILKRLRMYVLRSKVVLEPADDLVLLGISGQDAEKLIGKIVGEIPKQPDDCVQVDGATVVRIVGVQPRFEIVAETERAKKIWASASQSAQLCGASTWAWLDILAGQPTVFPETSEAFVPQMANLELVGGVNFKKGCYPGQEIVARMQYLGKLKQRMYRVHTSVATAPRPGMSLYADDFGEQSAGTIVDAQPSPGGGYDMLAVIQTTCARDGNVHLETPDGVLLKLETLPYPLA